LWFDLDFLICRGILSDYLLLEGGRRPKLNELISFPFSCFPTAFEDQISQFISGLLAIEFHQLYVVPPRAKPTCNHNTLVVIPTTLSSSPVLSHIWFPKSPAYSPLPKSHYRSGFPWRFVAFPGKTLTRRRYLRSFSTSPVLW
jgi:hypothetical protein